MKHFFKTFIIISFFLSFFTVLPLTSSNIVSAEDFCDSYKTGSTNSLRTPSNCTQPAYYKFNFPTQSNGSWICNKTTIQHCGRDNNGNINFQLNVTQTGKIKVYYKAPVAGTAKLTVGGRIYTKYISGTGSWSTNISANRGDTISFQIDHGDTPLTGWTSPYQGNCQGFRPNGPGNLGISELDQAANNDNATVFSKQCWGDGFRYEAGGPESNLVEIHQSFSSPNVNLTCTSSSTKNCNNALIEDMDFNDSATWIAVIPEAPTPTPTNNPTPTPTSRPTATPTPTGTPSPTATPTPTGIPHKSSCDDLVTISGYDNQVPAEVKFMIHGSDNDGDIKRYRIYFGDGQTKESTDPAISHTYEMSGYFTARAEIKDSKGNWKTSNACKTKVKIKESPIESHKSGCSDVYVSAPGGTQAPANINFSVSGYDNKGSIQSYKIEFGNGSNEENSSGNFTRNYPTAGTFTIRAFIKDSQGNWKGGDGSCKKSLYINTEPIEEQPPTGTPTGFTVVGLTSGTAGLTLTYLRRKFLI